MTAEAVSQLSGGKKGRNGRAARPSMRKAINDFCRWCISDPKSGEGNWRQQVEKCTSPDCPLYPLRPKSEGVNAKLRRSGGGE